VLCVFTPVDGLTAESKDVYAWARHNILVAHANGNASGITGTNCREAFLQSYAHGLRVFEMDFNLSSDHRLVGIHDWLPATLGGLGLKLPPNARLPLSQAAFKRQKIHGKLTPLGIEDVVHLLSSHRDAFLITDTKVTKGPEVAEAFTLIVKASRQADPRVLDRIIPQIYNRPMYDTVRAIHPFKAIIYTLYNSRDTDPQVVEFVQTKGIQVVVMPPWRATPEFLKTLGQVGVLTYVHTINQPEELRALQQRGVHGVYSDLITPKMIGKMH
jgi:glycerophosphoryl diester phosphodiesterase